MTRAAMMASSLVALARVGFDDQMSNHRVHFAGLGDTLQARCSCGRRSVIGSRSDCEMWHQGHIHEVQRIRAHLGTRTPTLKSQHAWFCEQAENTDNDPEDRALWRQLADELGAFIEVKGAPALQQDALF